MARNLPPFLLPSNCLMWGSNPYSSKLVASYGAHAARLQREIRASSRLRYAVLLGVSGTALLFGTAVIGLERQRQLESHAARIAPMDAAGGVFYLVERPVEAIIPLRSASLAGANAAVWLAAAALLSGMAALAWFAAHRRQRREEARLQRYRRPRPSRLPARVVAKRQALRKLLRSEGADRGRSRLTVRQLMTESVVTAPPSASVQTLTNLLTSSPVRHVMICDFGGRLLGIVGDRDLRHRPGRRASEIMTSEPVSVPPGALLAPAVALMVEHQVSCLPVVEEGRVRGVLTADDLAMALDCVLQLRESPATHVPEEIPLEETALLSDVQTMCITARSVDADAEAAPPAPASQSS